MRTYIQWLSIFIWFIRPRNNDFLLNNHELFIYSFYIRVYRKIKFAHLKYIIIIKIFEIISYAYRV